MNRPLNSSAGSFLNPENPPSITDFQQYTNVLSTVSTVRAQPPFPPRRVPNTVSDTSADTSAGSQAQKECNLVSYF